jgi:AraC family transcriptional regulator of adaptative response / DNA-3-methyladenine glycosylase II
MRLIYEGVLDDDGDEVLAGRLGIGARHLSRLFRKHLGASPTQVARTARVQRAKRLIDGTDLPMTEIALNAVFAEVYKRSPTEIRRVRRLSG